MRASAEESDKVRAPIADHPWGKTHKVGTVITNTAAYFEPTGRDAKKLGSFACTQKAVRVFLRKRSRQCGRATIKVMSGHSSNLPAQAKTKALEKQFTGARDDARARINRRIATLRTDYEKRAAKLKQAGQLTKEALAA